MTVVMSPQELCNGVTFSDASTASRVSSADGGGEQYLFHELEKPPGTDSRTFSAVERWLRLCPQPYAYRETGLSTVIDDHSSSLCPKPAKSTQANEVRCSASSPTAKLLDEDLLAVGSAFTHNRYGHPLLSITIFLKNSTITNTSDRGDCHDKLCGAVRDLTYTMRDLNCAVDRLICVLDGLK